MANTNQGLLSSTGNLNRLSDHQKSKNSGRQDRRATPKTPKGQPPTESQPKDNHCKFCGSKNHSSQLTDCRENCPAFTETCTACGTVGHFKNVCRGGPRNKSQKRRSGARPKVAQVSGDNSGDKDGDKTPAQDAELGTLNGSWFLINGHQGLVSSLKTGQQGKQVPHQIYSDGKWKNSKLEDHGCVLLQLQVCQGVVTSRGSWSRALHEQPRYKG